MKLNIGLLFDKSIMIWLALLLVLQIIYSNQLVNHARKVDELDNMRRSLSDENEALKQQVAAITSLQSIEARSRALGFVKNTRLISLDLSSIMIALHAAK